jgi:hypothetical protein
MLPLSSHLIATQCGLPCKSLYDYQLFSIYRYSCSTSITNPMSALARAKMTESTVKVNLAWIGPILLTGATATFHEQTTNIWTSKYRSVAGETTRKWEVGEKW